MNSPLRWLCQRSLNRSFENMPRGAHNTIVAPMEYDFVVKSAISCSIERVRNNGIGRCVTNITLELDRTGENVTHLRYGEDMAGVQEVVAHEGTVKSMELRGLLRATATVRQAKKTMQQSIWHS